MHYSLSALNIYVTCTQCDKVEAIHTSIWKVVNKVPKHFKKEVQDHFVFQLAFDNSDVIDIMHN